MDIFFQQRVNGLTIGAMFALIALGYTMVYGGMKLIILPTEIWLQVLPLSA